MNKLKAGQTVIIKDDNFSPLEVGSKWVIDSTDGSSYIIIDKFGTKWYFTASDLETVESESDAVNSPSHYKFGKSEVIDIVENLSYCRGNIIKYVSRAGRKAIADELEDLEKAKWYLEREIARLKKSGDQ